jgi:hypothetical protein
MQTMLASEVRFCSARVFLCLVLLGGCAPSLSTFQTAAVPPTGHFSASAGVEYPIPLGTIYDVYSTGKDVLEKADNDQALTTAEKWQAFDTGVELLLSPPFIPGYHLSFAYVPWQRLEVSLRYASSALRLGTRYQVLDRNAGAPFDLSAGIGFSYFTYAIPIGDYVPILKVDDFTRWQIDIPLLMGMQNRWFRTWFGPRFIATFFDTALRLDLKVEEAVLASMSGKAYYVGGQGGIGFGYRWLFVAFELTVTEMMGSATFTANALADSPSHTTELSGLVIYPTLGLMGEW